MRSKLVVVLKPDRELGEDRRGAGQLVHVHVVALDGLDEGLDGRRGSHGHRSYSVSQAKE